MSRAFLLRWEGLWEEQAKALSGAQFGTIRVTMHIVNIVTQAELVNRQLNIQV